MAATVAMHLDPSRSEPILCATRSPVTPAFVEALGKAGVRVIALERKWRGSLSAWRPLVALLRRERVDVLHSHMFGSNFWGTIFGRLGNVPVLIVHEHGWNFEGQPLRRFLDRALIARGADVFVVVSREDRRRMIEIEKIDPRRIRVVRNGIRPISPSRSGDVRREFRIEADVPVIGSVGHLVPVKAFDVLVESAALLAQEFADLRVLIVGDGTEEERLRRLIASRGLQDNVLLLGVRSDVPNVVAALDVAVCCSDHEGSPLSVMEYMAAGKPVVATRVGGLPDLVEDGLSGFLVERRNPHELAKRVATLLREPELRAAMGARGRERQQREFDLELVVQRLEDLYEQLYLASKRRRERGIGASHDSKAGTLFTRITRRRRESVRDAASRGS